MKTDIFKCEARRPKFRKKTTYSLHKGDDSWKGEDYQCYFQGETWGYHDFRWMMKRHIKEKANEQD